MTTNQANQVNSSGQPGQVHILPIGGRIGAEIRNVVLSADIDDRTVSAIRDALLKYKVVFFRDQHHMDDDIHEAFTERFGDPIKHPLAAAAGKSKFLLNLASSEGYAASAWHTDMTFLPAYPAASILRPLVLPEAGGDTMWANTAAAYQDLPKPLQQFAESLKAIHGSDVDFEALFDEDTRGRLGSYSKTPPKNIFRTEHPVVRVHPETSERCLLLGQFARRLVGYDGHQSAQIFALFQDYICRPENTIRWRWRLGDVAIWDNRATQHRAVADFGDETRHFRRSTIHGTVAKGIDGTESRQLNAA